MNLLLFLNYVLLLGIFLLLILVYLQLLRMGRKRNKVVVPSLTVVVDKASYLHGDTVTISGELLEDNAAVPAQAVVLTLPDGTTPNVTTDGNGKYSTTWVVPDTVSGVLTVTATALGITATTTFTLKSCISEECEKCDLYIEAHKPLSWEP